MSEVFFILTTLFVVYVVFSVINDEKKDSKKQAQEKKITQPTTPEIKVVLPKVAPSVTKKTKSTINVDHKKNLTNIELGRIRNLETGEVTKIPNNYRFSKRWIKEILVKEGLLDKIYKNNELDSEEINAKIKQALVKLQAIEKYHP